MGLLIVAYLFLGGAGAGAFAFLACIDMRFRGIRSSASTTRRPSARAASSRESRRVAILLRRGYAVSLAALCVGCVCLLGDLGRPDAAFLLFARPTFTYITAGSFSLVILMLCAAFLAVENGFTAPRFVSRVRSFFLVIGLGAAAFVMAYTGLFLQSMKANVLWNTPFLVALFVLSALSTGIAIVTACSFGLGANRRGLASMLRLLLALDALLIVLEAVAAVAFLWSVSGTEVGRLSIERLVAGDVSGAFLGGFALCGLVVPGIGNAVAAIRGRCDERMAAGLACLVLIGGYCLRFSMFEARVPISIF